jgi:hypothetical protein
VDGIPRIRAFQIDWTGIFLTRRAVRPDEGRPAVTLIPNRDSLAERSMLSAAHEAAKSPPDHRCCLRPQARGVLALGVH